MRGRAFRRSQLQRMKERVKGYFIVAARWKHDKRIVGMAARTPKPCSCPCCGNERKHFANVTMQEKRASVPHTETPQP